MLKAGFIESAEDAVLGQRPEEPRAAVGFNLAEGYFAPIIEIAERVKENMREAPPEFDKTLRAAFAFSDYDSFQKFPEETRQVLDDCTARFRKRYQSLLTENPVTAP